MFKFVAVMLLTVLATSADAQVAVSFNYSATGERYTDPYRRIERSGHDQEEEILSFIAAAKTSVHVAAYEMWLPRLAKLLAAKVAAGVQVRVILDHDNNAPFTASVADCEALDDYYAKPRCLEKLALLDQDQDGSVSPPEALERDTIVILRAAGVAIVDDTFDLSQGSGIMHHKFIVVDGSDVLVSSGNFTLSCTHGDYSNPESRGNVNALARFRSPELAAVFDEEFSIMWGNGVPGTHSRFGLKKPFRQPQSVRVGQATVVVKFSPTSTQLPYADSTNGWISTHLRQAASSIAIANFVFSEQQLADTMAERWRALPDLVVTVLGEREFLRYYSELLDLWGIEMLRLPTEAPRNPCTYEAGNNPWRLGYQDRLMPPTVGLVRMAAGDKMHHKFAVLDRHVTLFGSHNWSAAANRTNDETLLAITSDFVAEAFSREVERLAASAHFGPSAALLQEIKSREEECGSSLSNRHKGAAIR